MTSRSDNWSENANPRLWNAHFRAPEHQRARAKNPFRSFGGCSDIGVAWWFTCVVARHRMAALTAQDAGLDVAVHKTEQCGP